MNTDLAVPIERIAQAILLLRGQKVLLDQDLAALYSVPTKRFNEQVKRNLERFPPDFRFQLSEEEFQALRSQIATLKTGRGQHRKYLPYAFTEHGALMAASVLNSPRAIEVSVYVVRAFVQLREMLASHQELAQRLDELEARLEQKLDTHDKAIVGLLNTLRELMQPQEPPKNRPIGFVIDENGGQ